ncbi:hypothetical protein EST38_g3117 [Candolleomyces aberdarensis]|uniref:DUF7330 domain-containing protein n=1 Tax=Candolleomyces aberdarensis TaxID=2316362 RepID=A0A4Q2DRA7_9AGAR|nr:hypothetical protein EST38_g3117 [Candolleomyces aberdarensis]
MILDTKADSTRQIEETSAGEPSTSKGPRLLPDEGTEELGAPPPYSSLEENSRLPGPSEPLPKATNFVSLFKLNGSVKGTWVINPTIPLPAPFLQPVDPSQTENVRKNLYLKSHNGAVSADVSLVPTVSDEASRVEQSSFVVLEAETFNGSVTLKLHELTSAYPGKSRLPLRIKLNTYNGSVYVKIPRSFRGMILSQCWWGSTKLSAQVKAQVAYERDEGRIKRMFIGELDETDFSESSWSGDELNAETRNGNVYVKYEDEEEEQGFWSKLWGTIFFLSPS